MFYKNFIIVLILSIPTHILSMDESSNISSSSSDSLKKAGKKSHSSSHSAEKRKLLQAKTFVKRISGSDLGKSTSHEKLDLQKLNFDQDHNKNDSFDNTPLICAAQQNNPSLMTQLLAYDDIEVNHKNKVGNTALHFATLYGHGDCITLLLAHKNTDASVKNNDGRMPHDCLNENTNNYFCVKNKLFRNYLMHLPPYTHSLHFDIEKIVANKEVNAVDLNGTSVLMWSIWSNQSIATIQKLLSYQEKIEANYQDSIFGTALHYAALFDRIDAIKLLLLDHRTNVCIENKFKLRPHACLITPACHNQQNSCQCAACAQYLEIRALLFARAWLHMTVKEYLSKSLLSSCFTKHTSLDAEIIAAIITHIKNSIDTEKKTQTTEIPEASCLPDYANDTFLTKMIKYSYDGFILKASD